MKKCSKCGITKSFDGFAKEHKAKDGRSSQCKACKHEYDEAQLGPILPVSCANENCNQVFLPRNRKQHKYCSGLCRKNKRNRGWVKRSPVSRRRCLIKYYYRLDESAYLALLEKQNQCCALCKEPFGEETPCIDHDHRCCAGQKTCGRCVRGIIHQKCNRALGIFGDDPKLFMMAHDYLNFYGRK